MNQLNSPRSVTPPQRNTTELPILVILKEGYLLWHSYLIHLPRLTRYTLGVKIDTLFTKCLELALFAAHVSRSEKLDAVQRLSVKVDSLKFFVTLLWELKGIDNNKYTLLSRPLSEIGKMVGGWLASCKKETLPM